MNIKQAYQLFHNGAIALAEIERTGIRIDIEYCKSEYNNIKDVINRIEKMIFSKPIGKEWKKRYKEKTSLASPEQIEWAFFDFLKLDSIKKTTKGKRSTDKDTLSQIDHPLAKALLEWRKYDKLSGTYLQALLREVGDDGLLHTFFNLNTVITYRSSSDSPNFQNIPIRDPMAGKLIRSAFIPRQDHHFVELDYKALEVYIAYCYHQDPTMREYLETGYDMHGDMAQDCYLISKLDYMDTEENKKMWKKIRFRGKSSFVFPAFYGSYYVDIAKSLWDSIEADDLRACDGQNLYDYLNENHNITCYEDYELYIKDVEYKFWNERFPVYNQWKKDWYAQYQRRGWFDLKTGFRCKGIYKRNEVINYCVQGAAFHCLLWSLTQIHNALKPYKSFLIGQIHDSIIADVHKDELQMFLQLAKKVSTQDVREQYDWINIPLNIEAEVSPLNKSWYYKQETEI